MEQSGQRQHITFKVYDVDASAIPFQKQLVKFINNIYSLKAVRVIRPLIKPVTICAG